MAEWGADEEATEISSDNDDVIIYDLEGAVVEIRDFAEHQENGALLFVLFALDRRKST